MAWALTEDTEKEHGINDYDHTWEECWVYNCEYAATYETISYTPGLGEDQWDWYHIESVAYDGSDSEYFIRFGYMYIWDEYNEHR